MKKAPSFTAPRYTIEVYSTPQEKATHADTINQYYELRRRVYTSKVGPEQEKYYGQYPTAEDARESTVFLIFKGTDPQSGKQVIFGGRRIVFPDNGIGSLPLESKHDTHPQAIKGHIEKLQRGGGKMRHNGFTDLLGKSALDMTDVVPALKQKNDIRYAELGAFAIDQAITNRLFEKRDDYIAMREDIYKISLEAARNAGADIVVVDAGRANREHQEQWLRKSKEFEFVHLGKTASLFSNPFSDGNETQLLLIKTSDRFLLKQAEGILRYNQQAARATRDDAKQKAR